MEQITGLNKVIESSREELDKLLVSKSDISTTGRKWMLSSALPKDQIATAGKVADLLQNLVSKVAQSVIM